MDKTVLVPIAQGTEETEAVVVIDLLRRAGIEVKVAGENEIVTCSRGVKIIPDILIENLRPDDYFIAIVLPGGTIGTERLKRNESLDNLLKAHRAENRLIAAICAAPTILTEKKLISPEYHITSHPSVKSQVAHYKYSEETVVNEGDIITSRGAGTAFDFAIELIKVLAGEEAAERVARETVYIQ